MKKPFHTAILLAAGVLTAGSLQAAQIMSVAYGTITGVSQQERDTSGGARGGALLGGIAGAAYILAGPGLKIQAAAFPW